LRPGDAAILSRSGAAKSETHPDLHSVFVEANPLIAARGKPLVERFPQTSVSGHANTFHFVFAPAINQGRDGAAVITSRRGRLAAESPSFRENRRTETAKIDFGR